MIYWPKNGYRDNPRILMDNSYSIYVLIWGGHHNLPTFNQPFCPFNQQTNLEHQHKTEPGVSILCPEQAGFQSGARSLGRWVWVGAVYPHERWRRRSVCGSPGWGVTSAASLQDWHPLLHTRSKNKGERESFMRRKGRNTMLVLISNNEEMAFNDLQFSSHTHYQTQRKELNHLISSNTYVFV